MFSSSRVQARLMVIMGLDYERTSLEEEGEEIVVVYIKRFFANWFQLRGGVHIPTRVRGHVPLLALAASSSRRL